MTGSQDTFWWLIALVAAAVVVFAGLLHASWNAIVKGSAGRPAIEKTIASLVSQSKLLVESASAVGIAKLTLVEP